MKHLFIALLICRLVSPALAASLTYVEQIPVDTFAKMREVERYQLKVAEKFYLKGEYKAAASEYEKFITLYERSLAAPYAQLMWSHCLIKQRRVYTAIRDGFQSVIDYWPDSHEAVLAGYLIGHSYQAAGELPNATKAYARAIAAHPKHYTSVLAKWNLVEIYRIQKDQGKRVKIWEDLTYSTKRSKENNYYTTQASCNLGQHHFYQGDFPEGLKALETTYGKVSLVRRLYQHASNPIHSLTGDQEKAKTGGKLADDLIAYIQKQIPTDLKDDANAVIAREYYYIMADIHSRARRDSESLAVYEKLGKLIGVNDDLRGKQAAWHRARKRYGEARKIYAQYKDREAGLSATASTWINEKKWDNAISTYNQLIGLDKEKESQWQQSIAGVWRKAGEWDKAIATYRLLLTMEAGKFGDWYWRIAECYENAGKFKESIRCYQQSDKYPGAYMEMAYVHRKRLKQWDEALTLYHQVRVTYKGSGAKYKGRATGNREVEVEPFATQMIGSTYEEKMVTFKEGSEAWKMTRNNAIKWFQQTCKLYPKTSHASQAHAHLQSKYKISVTLGGANEKE